MIIAEMVFTHVSSRPDVSRRPTVLPTILKPKNHSQDTAIQTAAKASFSSPAYFKELVPTTTTVSSIACGFNNDTDIAKAICFFGEKE
jgi:hypothetical protein